ncbi:MAG: DUF190 domain-containing protein [Candidatus Omnitrophota bacterium]|nr:DUF190 domain-containing protein [Candidatus Omnitrophota bacterium]MBU1894651.1 DUF190 domain-containing protein [Candidatus Omnitrophota bacterium]
MNTSAKGKLLRIFVDEADKCQKRPLYEKIISFAKENKMAGATALKGIMGFGYKSHMHTAKLLRLSENLPIIVEIVDTEKKINDFLPLLKEIVKEGLITVEETNVIMHRVSNGVSP